MARLINEMSHNTKQPTKWHVSPAKTAQTGRMRRQIWAFAGRTGHFVSFVMRRLKLQLQLLSVINPHLPSGPIHPY